MPFAAWPLFCCPRTHPMRSLLVLATILVPILLHAQDDAAIRKKAEPCFACHGPNGNSQNPQYPILAGQSWRYLYIELQDFKAGRRGDPVMSPMAADLS